ncbi:MAG: toll/interleukin-1 receptor domain-containing protein [Firmicutes bacterium]|nr:toll/interleukin-1 receptor domain-containing protein [Bacillota bacterium]
MKGYNVFISYRGNGNGGFLGKEIYTDLKYCKSEAAQTPICPFFAPACIQKGDDYKRVIAETIRSVSCVILILSPGFFEGCTEKDDMVRFELQEALKNPVISFIPVVMEGFKFEKEVSVIEGLFSDDEIYRFKHINAINHHGVYDFNTEADVLPAVRKAIEECNTNVAANKASNVIFDFANFTPAEGRKVLFGNYPQRLLKDQNLIHRIYEGLATTETKKKDKKYEYGGESYYNISSSSFNKRVFETEIADNSHNFYIVQPIRWIEIFTSEKYSVLISHDIIDAERFNIDRNSHRTSNENEYLPPNDWAVSSIRRWLNNDFYYEAFSESERSVIQYAQIGNNKESCYPEFARERPDTTDKVFLVSHKEIYMSRKGVARVSDYAKAKGAYSSTSATSDGYGDWWTRSPGNLDVSVENVDRRGCLDAYPFCNYVNDTAAGVRPCIIVPKKELKYDY